MALGDAGDGRVVRRQAVEIDRHDDPWNQGVRSHRFGDRPVKVGRIHVERRRIDVDEHRGCPDRGDRACGRGEGKGGHEDRVARPHSHRHQGNHERVAAARHGDAVRHPGEGRQALFDEVDLRPEDELPVGKHRVHALAEIGLEPGALALQVEERNPSDRRH